MLAAIATAAALVTTALPVSCPLILPADTLVVRAPTGWTGYSPSIMRLTGFGMMAGPPQSLSYLVPSGSRKIKGGAASSWQFEAGEEKWLYCTYGGSSVIQIAKRLDDAATECTLTHRETKLDGITEMAAVCRVGTGR
jgi:hypothetical protein